ncbi:MAG: hypothetical protein AMXMBFR58_33260 [Phycisphaerae bacterium]|nr:hypothetical protein [Phycisphaerales bacterium]
MNHLPGPKTVVVLLCAAAASSAIAHPLQGPYRDGNRILATRPPVAEGMVNDVRAPGANGKLWISRGHIGDPEGKFPREYRLAWGSPGPAAYGAFEDDFSDVQVRVNEVAVAINPWESIPEAGYQHLERGREAWLRENGFTGGVRTFTNPVFRREQATVLAKAEPAKLPEPRMIIDLPPDMPRFKKRQEVDARPVRSYEPGSKPGPIVVVRTAKDEPVSPSIDPKAAAQVTVHSKPAKGPATEPVPVKVADAEKASAEKTPS